MEIRLKAGREKSVRNRHPWVFSGAIASRKGTAQPGDLVSVADSQGTLLGWGFYDPDSQITVRLLSLESQAPAVDSLPFWSQKMAQAWALRQRQLDLSHTNCFRLLHAEGDFLPGVVADVYGTDTLVCQTGSPGTERRLPLLVQAWQQLGFQHIYHKGKNLGEGQWLGAGAPTLPLEVEENGVRFYIDPIRGQKTGFFLDQRDNRALVGQHAAGKRVLNTFSYTGGFSMYALQAGAAEVVSVDVSAEAGEMCSRNAALNGFASEGEGARHKAVVADCFDYLRTLPEGHFDLIVLDPPAFAKHAGAVQAAARGYKDINLLGFRKVAAGGLVFTFSCSQHMDRELFRKIVFGAAADAGRQVRILAQLTQPADHPINIYHPEGEYLKGLLLYVD